VPTYNHHQNTHIVPHLLILPSFHNKPGSTEAECRTGKPRVTGSNLTAGKFFSFSKIILKIYSEDFENGKIIFLKKKK
jgi:hypothetical protein